MYNLVEFFSGIGSQIKALRNLDQKVNLVGSSEWDVHAIIAYDLIHNGDDLDPDIADLSKEQVLQMLEPYTFSNTGKCPLAFSSLKTYSLEVLQHLYMSIRRNHNFVDISSVDGTTLPPDIDILTYSFPCQDLSNVGAFHGYNKGIDKDSGSRSSLLWQVGRILSEMKEGNIPLPRFLLMENVPTLLSERHFTNFSTWIGDLRQLGYVSKYYQLNAADFGLPQNRPRLLMISVYVGNDTGKMDLALDYFRIKDEAYVVQDYHRSRFFHQYMVQDLLRTNYTNPKIFNEALESTPNDTVSRRKIWEDNLQIVLPGNQFNQEIDVIRTITTKQDRNPNSGNLYFESGVAGKSHFRYLTPRECLLFMGFSDEDFRKLKYNNLEFHKGDALFARDKVIRMAGNSIPVKMLEGIFYQIIQIDRIFKEYAEHSFFETCEVSEKKRYAKKITKHFFHRKIRCRHPGGQYPDTPDIIFPAYKAAIFIHDCFQHGHECEDQYNPDIHSKFWEQRIARIKEDDAAKYNELRMRGWKVLVVWKCELQNDRITDTLLKIEDWLRNRCRKGTPEKQEKFA